MIHKFKPIIYTDRPAKEFHKTCKKMMHQEALQSFLQQDHDQAGLDGLRKGFYTCDELDFYSSITTPEDCSIISLDAYFQTMLPSEFTTLPNLDDDMQVLFPTENILQHVEGIEGISCTALDDVLRWWPGESEEIEEPSLDYSGTSMVLPSMNLSMVLAPEDKGNESHTSLYHLHKAYGEAMEMGQRELANVIVGCLKVKAIPLGGTMERLTFSLFQSGYQVDYIKQESMKSFKVAFKAFYEIFPYGRFSHFAANSVILESVMSDFRKLHIIDFDIGEGVQWPAMLQAIGKLSKETKLTSIKTTNQSYSFEETKNQLADYASTCGLKLEVQEITIGDLMREIEGSEEHDFLAFNCMTELPHMGRTSNRSEVMEFLAVAKKLLLSNKGIITFCDGDDMERMKNCVGYSSFFDASVKHYHALYESMEENFPENLTEARIAMESLFVAPYVSSLSWHQKWENVSHDSRFKENLGLKGWKLSNDSLTEAKEMLKTKQNSYSIRVEGQNGNEMVLEWKGTPLVRFSAWK